MPTAPLSSHDAFGALLTEAGRFGPASQTALLSGIFSKAERPGVGRCKSFVRLPELANRAGPDTAFVFSAPRSEAESPEMTNRSKGNIIGFEHRKKKVLQLPCPFPYNVQRQQGPEVA